MPIAILIPKHPQRLLHLRNALVRVCAEIHLLHPDGQQLQQRLGTPAPDLHLFYGVGYGTSGCERVGGEDGRPGSAQEGREERGVQDVCFYGVGENSVWGKEEG